VQECRQEQQQWEHQHGEQEQGRGHRGGDREREQEQGRGHRGGDRERERQQEQGRGHRGGDREREGEHGQEQESRRPYVFGPRSFQRIVRSEQGFIKAIRPFQEESRLLRGIKNYRVAIMEANPRSFMVPGFSDADGVGYVAQGLSALR
jgi:hypothetical protein